jgi:hypothetical protein
MDWAVPYRCACGNTRRFQEILWEQEEEITRPTTRWAWIVGLWCDRCGAVLYEAPEVSILRLKEHTRSTTQMDQIYYERYRRFPEKPYAFLPEEPLNLELSDQPCRITLREVDQHSTIWHWLLRRIGQWFTVPSKDQKTSSRPACDEVAPPR